MGKAKDKGQLLILQGLCRDLRLPIPTDEHQFHATRKWKFDYAWVNEKVALEVEGGIWRRGGGAHSRPANIMRDIEKYNSATLLGWRIIRTTPQDLFKMETIRMIKTLIP